MSRAFSRGRLHVAMTLLAMTAIFIGAFWIAKGHQAPLANATEVKPALSETMVECRDLNGSDMPPRDSAKHTVIDTENSLLQISYRATSGELRTITVDYVNDQACRRLPEVRDVIAHALEAEEATQLQRCTYLLKAHADGVREIKGTPIDRAALGRYIQERCSG